MIFGRSQQGTRPSLLTGINRASRQAAGLVHWWPVTQSDGFDGAIARTNAVRDVVGNANASNVGNYTLGASPLGGYAIEGSSVGRLSITPDQARFSTAATVSCWIRLRVATPVVEPATGFCHLQSVAALSVYPYIDGTIYCGTLRSSTRLSFAPSSQVDRTQPHLVTITSDGTTWRFYQNGIIVHEASADASVPTFSSSLLHASDTTYWVNGWSWDWRMYNRALTPAEVRELYDPATRFELYAPQAPQFWLDATGPPPIELAGTVTATGTTTAALQTRTWLTPSADVTDGSWTPSAGGSDLFAMVNDSSDSTYIRSNSGTGTDTCELDFPSMGVPEAGPVTFTIRHRVV